MLETEEVHSSLGVWPRMGRMRVKFPLIIKGLVTSAAALMDRSGKKICDHTELLLAGFSLFGWCICETEPIVVSNTQRLAVVTVDHTISNTTWRRVSFDSSWWCNWNIKSLSMWKLFRFKAKPCCFQVLLVPVSVEEMRLDETLQLENIWLTVAINWPEVVLLVYA